MLVVGPNMVARAAVFTSVEPLPEFGKFWQNTLSAFARAVRFCFPPGSQFSMPPPLIRAVLLPQTRDRFIYVRGAAARVREIFGKTL